MLTANKGEWSEIYAFFFLLNAGILQSADKDLQPIKDIYYPILNIKRKEGNETFEYCIQADKNSDVLIKKDRKVIGSITKKELSINIKRLLTEIPLGKSAFSISDVEAFMARNFIHTVKADSSSKKDINIQIHDINSGINPLCGFSIKSFLGSNPTLINAGRNTNFTYTIANCSDNIMNATNAIKTKNKILDRLQYLNYRGCNISLDGEINSIQFNENLQFVDTMMPIILSEALAIYYKKSAEQSFRDVSSVIKELMRINPLHFSNTNMYEYKFKKFLCACALGATPEKHWEGQEDANGGYIIVKKDGDVVCYHIYNRTDFENYLYEYTYFEKASTERHQYMSVFKDNNQYKINFNLQIRFKN